MFPKEVEEYINKCFGSRFAEEILAKFDVKVISKGRSIYRISLIPKNISKVLSTVSGKVKPVGMGLVIGWLKNGKFIPSTHLFNIARERGLRYGCAVVAKSQGVKAFLYGKDLLVASVEGFIEPVEKGMYVAVVDSEDMMVIGIGKLVIDPKMFKEHLERGLMIESVVENVFDLGAILRNEHCI